MLKLLLDKWSVLEHLWMNELYFEQREYSKSRCLNPLDDDWRRVG